MAPSISVDFANSELSNKEKHKLRKPAVEKMRRDRINNSIEQLKAMLEKEFHKQDPNAKLEKADILEMTVLFLKQQLLQCHSQAGSGRGPQQQQQQQAHSDGYSQCWRGVLSLLPVKAEMDYSSSLRNNCHGVQTPSITVPTDFSPVSPVLPSPQHDHQALVKQLSVTKKSVWRPW
ncbi:transcription factor HES-5-like [Engraulis encrasicolus]|uniref:transcription factor HES-5-like n=1 Tax=Engraulis encrasicolus TaxID=184585 RepID=UPI002FD4A0D3